MEVTRAALRSNPSADLSHVTRVIEGFTLVPLDAPVLEAAQALAAAELRTLDALHLATALSLEADLGVLVAYDRRLLAAATAAGLPARSPGA